MSAKSAKIQRSRFNWAWGLCALVSSACEPIAQSEDFTRAPVVVFERNVLKPAPEQGNPAQLRVVAWNIKYAAGRIPFWFDCFGDRVEMTSAEVESNMQGIYGLINEIKPDILMTEETEINSKRSAYFNMVRGILEHTDLNYAAYFETWNSRYIASEGLGRLNLGNAIFSRYPIEFAEKIRQDDRTAQNALTKTFYIHRAVGRAEIRIRKDKLVTAMVVHTEAYDNDGTKQKQIKQIFQLMQDEKNSFLLGGDFNELPLTAARKEAFPDERLRPVCDSDFKQPPYTPEVMKPFYDTFLNHISLAEYGVTEADQRRYFSHTILGPDDTNDAGEHGFWNRTLDFLWIAKKDRWVPGGSDVLQQKGQKVGGDKGLGPVLQSDVLRLSDHAPVTGIWEVK